MSRCGPLEYVIVHRVPDRKGDLRHVDSTAARCGL